MKFLEEGGGDRQHTKPMKLIKSSQRSRSLTFTNEGGNPQMRGLTPHLIG